MLHRPLSAGPLRLGLRHAFLLLALLCAPGARAAAPTLDTAAIDALVARELETNRVPGLALAIVHRGELAYAKGYGQADLENPRPVTPDSVFAIASVSKPLLALAVARLVEQGKLGWHDPVAQHLPGTPESWRAITLLQLASHSAGIVRESPAFDGDKPRSDAELLAATYLLPLQSAPGERMEYCNVCYFALAEIISRVSGMPWPAYLDQALFQPAGLRDTRTTSVSELVPRRVRSYIWEDGRHRNAREYLALRPSGAFLSSVADLARFEAALQGDRIVSAAMRRFMETPVLLNNGKPGTMNPAALGYGLGWEISAVDGRRRAAHGGSLAGFRTLYARYPDEGWAVIILANSSSSKRMALEAAIARLLPRAPLEAQAGLKAPVR